MQNPNTWMVVANATNDVATATKAAEAGNRHILSSVVASYDDETVAGNLTVTVTIGGSAVALVYTLLGGQQLVLELRADENTAVSAALAAGGASVDGNVAIIGETG